MHDRATGPEMHLAPVGWDIGKHAGTDDERRRDLVRPPAKWPMFAGSLLSYAGDWH
jgi:hypothetical protein